MPSLSRVGLLFSSLAVLQAAALLAQSPGGRRRAFDDSRPVLLDVDWDGKGDDTGEEIYRLRLRGNKFEVIWHVENFDDDDLGTPPSEPEREASACGAARLWGAARAPRPERNPSE